MSDDQYFLNRTLIVRQIVLFIWAVFLLGMYFSGAYRSYLHPSLAWLLPAGAAVMLLMAVNAMRNLRVKHEHTAQCQGGGRSCSYVHRLRFNDVKPLLVFAVPILIVFFIPLTQGLTATMTGGIYSENFEESLAASFERDNRPQHDGIDEYYISEILGAPDKIPDPAIVIGMVLKIPGEKRLFRIIRFTLSCCAADARPLALQVRIPDENRITTDELKNNNWVMINGTVQADDTGILFNARSLRPIPQPEDQFIY